MKKQISELLREYEDIILDQSYKMRWLLTKNKTISYRMAVWDSIHKRSIERLEKAHQKLLECTGQKPQ